MTNFGVSIAIVRDSRVLLAKREDFEVWALPGGLIDPGESIAQAAVRETGEETGLQVELTRLVGTYSVHLGQWTSHSILFTARPVDGVLQPQTGETIDLGYFAPDDLPKFTQWWHYQQIQDALNGTQGVAWRINVDVATPFQNRHELYRLRDDSGLSRSEFYRYYFKKPENGPPIQELGAGSLTGEYE